MDEITQDSGQGEARCDVCGYRDGNGFVCSCHTSNRTPIYMLTGDPLPVVREGTFARWLREVELDYQREEGQWLGQDIP